jgi:hypothetical protein
MVRRIAGSVDKTSYAEQSESPYQNVNIYQLQTDPSDPSPDIGLGPPSVYNDPCDKDDRFKHKDDVRRQGERPQPSDRLDYRLTPTMVTVQEDPKTDEQGKPSDNVSARGMGEAAWEELNRETWRSEGPGGQMVQ